MCPAPRSPLDVRIILGESLDTTLGARDSHAVILVFNGPVESCEAEALQVTSSGGTNLAAVPRTFC